MITQHGHMAVATVYGRGIASRARVDARTQLAELSVFLFLILPSLLFSFVAEEPEALDFHLAAGAIMLRDTALVALVLFFLWRNREPLASIGLSRRGLLVDIFLGIVLYFPLVISVVWFQQLLSWLGFTFPAIQPPIAVPDATGVSLLSAVLLVVTVAVTEEVIFRGYLMMRIIGLTADARLAVLFSAVVFAIGHGYQGSAGVLTVGFLGMAFALAYLWRGSLTVPIVMHLLQDLLGLVIAPFFLP